MRLGLRQLATVRFGKALDAAREWVNRSDEANAVLVRTLRSSADLVVTL